MVYQILMISAAFQRQNSDDCLDLRTHRHRGHRPVHREQVRRDGILWGHPVGRWWLDHPRWFFGNAPCRTTQDALFRQELRHFGVTVHILEPGFFNTPLIDEKLVQVWDWWFRKKNRSSSNIHFCMLQVQYQCVSLGFLREERQAKCTNIALICRRAWTPCGNPRPTRSKRNTARVSSVKVTLVNISA